MPTQNAEFLWDRVDQMRVSGIYSEIIFRFILCNRTLSSTLILCLCRSFFTRTIWYDLRNRFWELWKSYSTCMVSIETKIRDIHRRSDLVSILKLWQLQCYHGIIIFMIFLFIIQFVNNMIGFEMELLKDEVFPYG